MFGTFENARSRGVRDILKAAQRDAMRKALNRILPTVFAVVSGVALLNFLLFMAGASYFGGDAVNGRIEGGRYFLWGYYNGAKCYHDVSRAVFLYSIWHVYSVLIAWVLMFVALFAMKQIEKTSDS